MKKNKQMNNRILAVLMAFAMVIGGISVPTASVSAASVTVPTVEGNYIFANGVPLVIENGGQVSYGNSSSEVTHSMVKYNVGAGDVYLDLQPDVGGVQQQADLNGYTIFGGGKEDISGGTSITMTGGSVAAIYGGGCGASVGSSSVVITGGLVTATVCGGGLGGTAADAYDVLGSKYGYIALTSPGIVNADSFDHVFYKRTGIAWTVKGNVTVPSDRCVNVGVGEELSIEYGAVLNLPSNTSLNNLGVVTIADTSCLAGSGNVYGSGSFYINQITQDMITVPMNLEYTGADLTETAKSQISCEIPNGTVTVMRVGFQYRVSGWQMGISPSAVQNAGDYVVTYTRGNQSVAKTFSVKEKYKPRATIVDAGTYKTSYTYSGAAIPGPKASDYTTDAEVMSYVWYDENGVQLTDAPVLAGTYTLKIMTENCNLLAANALEVTVVINKALMPKELPAFAMTVANDVTVVSQVELPQNWVWDQASASITIPSGSSVEARANYVGSDATSYQVVSTVVTVLRDDCTLVQVERVEPTALTLGREAYWTCTVCGKNFADATGTMEISDLTVLDIPALGAPEKGISIPDEDGQAVYRITKSGYTGGTVEYVKPVNNKIKKVVIPTTVIIDGICYQVTSIAKNAFKKSSITSVSIGKYVKSIGANAFYGCKKLTKVTIGSAVTTIDSKAFSKCVALTKLTIPSKVKSIGANAFSGCKKLKTITIKTSKLTKKSIGKNAFKGVHSKATVKIPKKKYKTYVSILKTKGFGKKVRYKKF